MINIHSLSLSLLIFCQVQEVNLAKVNLAKVNIYEEILLERLCKLTESLVFILFNKSVFKFKLH